MFSFKIKISSLLSIISIVAIMAWNIWNFRIDCLHGNPKANPPTIVTQSMRFFHEFTTAKVVTPLFQNRKRCYTKNTT